MMIETDKQQEKRRGITPRLTLNPAHLTKIPYGNYGKNKKFSLKKFFIKNKEFSLKKSFGKNEEFFPKKTERTRIIAPFQLRKINYNKKLGYCLFGESEKRFPFLS